MHSVWGSLLVYADRQDGPECSVAPNEMVPIETSFFRDGNRLQTALIGSWWSGLQRSSPIHIRSVFDDIPETGSEMQFSAMMLNLWEKACAEQQLPEEWVVGADNIPKETKNKFVMWGFMWLLCVLSDTHLSSSIMCFLLVGHTHDKIDRFFFPESRLHCQVVIIGRWTRLFST